MSKSEYPSSRLKASLGLVRRHLVPALTLIGLRLGSNILANMGILGS